MSAAPHIPVLLDEVIAGLAPQSGEIHVDGTFGAGGYTRAILTTGAQVVAFDRDPDAIAESYWNVLQQPRSAWSWELELRPWVEKF